MARSPEKSLEVNVVLALASTAKKTRARLDPEVDLDLPLQWRGLLYHAVMYPGKMTARLQGPPGF
jgi:hypothetical protein